jgi:glycosyltransferase involved in cell wall biosynthesis
MKISGLIFSADSIQVTEDAARHLSELCDEVVVMYCTSYKEFVKLKSSAPDWMKVFYVLKLGYPEPYRNYAVDCCKNDWIILLDTDERFNNLGKIREIIEEADADVLTIRRLEKRGSDFSTKQYRIFKKGHLKWKGNLHEHPMVKGTVFDIPSKRLVLIHNKNYLQPRGYMMLNELLPASSPSHLAAIDAMVAFRINGANFIKVFADRYAVYSLAYKKNKAACDAIRRIGVTKILGLDRPSVVEKLNKSYRAKRQGIELLAQLLKKATPNHV